MNKIAGFYIVRSTYRRYSGIEPGAYVVKLEDNSFYPLIKFDSKTGALDLNHLKLDSKKLSVNYLNTQPITSVNFIKPP